MTWRARGAEIQFYGKCKRVDEKVYYLLYRAEAAFQNDEETFLILEKNNDFVGPAETIMPLKISSIKKLYELGIISSDRIDLELLRDE